MNLYDLQSLPRNLDTTALPCAVRQLLSQAALAIEAQDRPAARDAAQLALDVARRGYDTMSMPACRFVLAVASRDAYEMERARQGFNRRMSAGDRYNLALAWYGLALLAEDEADALVALQGGLDALDAGGLRWWCSPLYGRAMELRDALLVGVDKTVPRTYVEVGL